MSKNVKTYVYTGLETKTTKQSLTVKIYKDNHSRLEMAQVMLKELETELLNLTFTVLITQ